MDERIPLSIKIITGFSVFGLFFTTYLIVVNFFTDTCVARDACLQFLGWPLCVYGFILFVILMILLFYIIKKHIDIYRGMLMIASVAFSGILFSGYVGAFEFTTLLRQGVSGSAVPGCLIGLLVYMCIFATSILSIAHYRRG